MERVARRFAEWTATLPDDVEATWKLVTDEKMAQPARKLLAGALSYLLTQLDLIPDHEKAGAIDDAFVLRVAFGLGAEHLGKAADPRVGRLMNDEDTIKDFLGEATFAKLRAYVQKLPDKAVRGRSVEQILGDARAKQDMKRELDQTMKHLKPTLIDDDATAEAIEVSIKSYLKMKLGG
jgi:uncharacterized membrane protein YkvA (DUF1232 family)